MSTAILVLIAAAAVLFVLTVVFRQANRDMKSNIRNWPATPPGDDLTPEEWERRL